MAKKVIILNYKTKTRYSKGENVISHGGFAMEPEESLLDYLHLLISGERILALITKLI